MFNYKIGATTVFLMFVSFIVPGKLAAQERPTHAFPIVRSKMLSKSVKFGPGGTISLIGAPVGSIEVRGWEKHKVEVSAEIKVRAGNEEDAARLAAVTGFYVDEQVTSVRIYSVGTHDRKAVKKIDKKFPKRLRRNPFSINYVIMVPVFSDLRIDGGKGDFNLRGVEGVLSANLLESDAKLTLVGGQVDIAVGKGSVECTIGTRSWRGRSAQIQVASGDMRVYLPRNLNANIFARVLRNGSITDEYGDLTPRDRTESTSSFMDATAGNGGARLSFMVGSGNLSFVHLEKTGT